MALSELRIANCGGLSTIDYGLIALCLSGMAMSGCGMPVSEAKAQKSIITINELRLTQGELEQELEASGIAPHERRALPGEEPEWLSRLIERELLVQEAQQRGLDREPEFMRTIERFWKEALIKLLISRKAQEIAAQVHVYEPEIEAYYQSLSQETQARILSFADATSANLVASSGNLLEEALATVGSALVDDSGWQWYTSGMLEPAFESLLGDTQPGMRSAPMAHRGRWIIVAVAERRARSIEPLAVLQDEIARTIRQHKEAQALERWIAELKGRARIEVDREAIATLP